MGEREILDDITRLLTKNKIPYLLTGSFAVSYYGIPRATHDIDLIIEVSRENYSQLKKTIDGLDRSYLIDNNQIKEAIEKSSQFDILHLDSGIKIDFWLVKQTDFDLSKLKRGENITLYGQKIHLVSPEDLILTKLLWCKQIRSEKHIRDCAGIWKVQGKKLDKKYLELWVKRLAVEKFYKEMQKTDLEKYL
ncbi:nucleotidyl transferase AbiEii/AbiGii toxin family protein [Candidatus Microgenomates bacterium]|nr:nucleotidyl transferase AbiEii/AbiGii toxin family protein [Candidatus Microgenomates bacterium]